MFAKIFSVAIMMSQVIVCCKQAVCSWGGFHLRPTFAEVVEACEYLGRQKKAKSGVNIFLLSNKLLNIYFELYNLVHGNCAFVYAIRSRSKNNMRALSENGNTFTCQLSE